MSRQLALSVGVVAPRVRNVRRPLSSAEASKAIGANLHYKVVAVRYSRSKIALLAEFNSRKQQVLGFLHTLTILSEKCGP